MKIFKRLKWALPIALVLTLVAVGVALALTSQIDHFDTSQTVNLTCASPQILGPLATSVPDTSVLGGERDLVSEITQCNGGTTDSLEASVNKNGNSALNVVSGANIFYITQVIWDGSSDSNKTLVDYTGLEKT